MWCLPAAMPIQVASYVRCYYNPTMPGIRFEWDPKKAEANLRKHKVSFEEAQSVFSTATGPREA